jgi:hypothetical protein
LLKPEAFIHDNASSMPQVQPVAGIPTRIDVAFTNKAGVEKGGIRKSAEKTLMLLAPALRQLLRPNEFVLYTAAASAPMSGLEQYTFGYFAQFVSRVTLVFTNLRILAFRVDTKGKWRNSLRGCALGDIKSGKISGWISASLKLQYANGKKESYWAIKSRDKAKLKVIVPRLLEANAGEQTPAQAMQPLCPICAAVLVAKQYECNGCGQKFRNEDSLWWRTFIPGGAYFYAKQGGMGVLHAVVDSFVFLEFLLIAIGIAIGGPAERTQDAWIAVAWIAFLLLFERSIALWHARRFVREFIPIEGTARSQGAAAGR